MPKGLKGYAYGDSRSKFECDVCGSMYNNMQIIKLHYKIAHPNHRFMNNRKTLFLSHNPINNLHLRVGGHQKMQPNM